MSSPARLGATLSEGAPQQWGIEGAGTSGRGLAQSVLATGMLVYEINARWTAAWQGTMRSYSEKVCELTPERA